MKMTKIYEIRWESTTDSGSRLIRAGKQSEAIQKFVDRYKDSDTPVPTFWVQARFYEEVR
jgi:hypothetical protein